MENYVVRALRKKRAIWYPHNNSMSEPDHNSSNSLSPTVLITASILVLIAVWLIAPSFGRLSERGFLTTQMLNARQIVDLLRMYAEDHEGRYPDNLTELIGMEPRAEQMLKIELEDGHTARQWFYHHGLSDKDSGATWILVSPPLYNNKIGRFERWRRQQRGGLQPPPDKPWRVFVCKDGSVEFMPESKFQHIIKLRNIVLPGAASIDEKEK